MAASTAPVSYGWPQVHLPVKLMGDLVVSLDTAQRQATERGCARCFGGLGLGGRVQSPGLQRGLGCMDCSCYGPGMRTALTLACSGCMLRLWLCEWTPVLMCAWPGGTLPCHRHTLLDEIRVLLVHGLLHLAGYDHEKGEKEHQVGGTPDSWHDGGGGRSQCPLTAVPAGGPAPLHRGWLKEGTHLVGGSQSWCGVCGFKGDVLPGMRCMRWHARARAHARTHTVCEQCPASSGPDTCVLIGI